MDYQEQVKNITAELLEKTVGCGNYHPKWLHVRNKIFVEARIKELGYEDRIKINKRYRKYYISSPCI